MEAAKCQRCWPKLCRCPPELEQVTSERFDMMKQLDAEVARRKSAEAVIQKILDAHSEGELSLSFVVDECKEYAANKATGQ